MFTESAGLYDAIYSTFKNYAAEADAIASLVRTAHPGAKTMLDVACGTGEHAKHLHLRHGFVVDGLDLDPKLLAVARRKLPSARFFEADMSAFALAQRYDVIACMFSAIGYLKTLDRVTDALQCFRKHLAPNGVIIVEPWFQPGVLDLGPGKPRTAEVDGVRVERTSSTAIAGTISTLTFNYRIEGPDGVRTAEEVHELGLFTRDEMLASFHDAGLGAMHDPVGMFNNRGLYVARAVA